jgi:hypothetical protein
VFVVVASALVVVLVYALTGSWVTGGVVGAMSGGLFAGICPLSSGDPRHDAAATHGCAGDCAPLV